MHACDTGPVRTAESGTLYNLSSLNESPSSKKDPFQPFCLSGPWQLSLQKFLLKFLNRARTRNGESGTLPPNIGLADCDLHRTAHAIKDTVVAIAGTPVRHSGCHRMIGRARWAFRRRRQLSRPHSSRSRSGRICIAFWQDGNGSCLARFGHF